MRRLCLAVLMVLIYLLGSWSWTQAAVVTPESVTLTVQPGQKVHQTLNFENDGQATESYSLDISGINFGSSADDLRFYELEPSRLAWIATDKSSFTLEPGASQAIEVTISVPEAVESEVFAFAVIATTSASTSEGVGITSGLAPLVFVNIGEGLDVNLVVDSFSTVPTNVHHLPVRFAALVRNTGPGLAEPQIGVVMRNVWGKETELVSLNPTGRRLPGHTDRIFSGEWQGSPWHFGPYTAELYVFAENSDAPITATTSMVLFPWQMLCVFAVLVLLTSLGIVICLRARRR